MGNINRSLGKAQTTDNAGSGFFSKNEAESRKDLLNELDEKLKNIGISLSANTLDSMLSIAPDLKCISKKELENRIKRLQNAGCTDIEKTGGILGSCPGYLCRSLSDIDALFGTLKKYGFTDLGNLFFANPLILDLDGFEIEAYIKKEAKENGKSVKNIASDLQDKPYLFEEIWTA